MKHFLCVCGLVLSLLACKDVSPADTNPDASPLPQDSPASTPPPVGRIVDHEYATVSGLTQERLHHAKDSLAVAYWHTSHGSQLIVGVGQEWDGSSDMDDFYGSNGWYVLDLAAGPAVEGGLYIDEPGASVCQFSTEEDGWDLDISIDRFELAVRGYLDNPDNSHTNVVIASWCGGVSGASESSITHYLNTMNILESDYPGIVFVYMTGHADGSGLDGNLHLRNQQIRAYCETNNKWLFDFYDIDCHDPDGNYFGDRFVNDECEYDNDSNSGNGLEGNWALEWQTAHPDGWWDCPPDYHTQPVNRNQKAKAAWQLWCLIAEART
ncbi:MAG: hypothetical protein JXB03_12800 [Spirochaetales bacterium]|nr:hypothetical protein [Spirochaetales bacterium]